MNKAFSRLFLGISKVNKVHLQYTLMLITLAMLVLGAGAPEDVGGGTR